MICGYWPARLRNYETQVVLSDEHQDLRWLQAEEAATLCGFGDMAALFRDFQARVEGGKLVN